MKADATDVATARLGQYKTNRFPDRAPPIRDRLSTGASNPATSKSGGYNPVKPCLLAKKVGWAIESVEFALREERKFGIHI